MARVVNPDQPLDVIGRDAVMLMRINDEAARRLRGVRGGCAPGVRPAAPSSQMKSRRLFFIIVTDLLTEFSLPGANG
jgi:hypothetical protein